MKTQTKILGFLLFFLLLIGVFYLSLIVNDDTHEDEIKVIQLIGCDLISKENYLKFARLDKSDNYKDINSIIIRDRFIKHPYIKTVTVQFTDKNILTVKITEKNIKCLILGDTITKAITDNFEFIPYLKDTRNNNWIKLTNFDETSTKIFTINKSNNIVKIFKVLDIMQNIDPELLSKIVRIDNAKNQYLTYYTSDNNIIKMEYDKIEKTTFILSKIYSNYIKNISNSYINMLYDNFVYFSSKIPNDSVKNIGI
ncbi:MAG TPA: hypothetical protein PLI27_10715 [Ignavibacteriales bacterium]|nr:hypothetical protein [Ignavibacteriales bacterium]HOL81268.1 hypothetical protein [Ignavibacteriales bacterium]HOM66213.1 hypothetical protein [Ignavibacteriales bacterium]HPD68532.1 hypothetical protein [Ignavibacteriales bacterium]HPP33379.1 hypothetical protein [Ignavibacteriales bacterium]